MIYTVASDVCQNEKNGYASNTPVMMLNFSSNFHSNGYRSPFELFPTFTTTLSPLASPPKIEHIVTPFLIKSV